MKSAHGLRILTLGLCLVTPAQARIPKEVPVYLSAASWAGQDNLNAASQIMYRQEGDAFIPDHRIDVQLTSGSECDNYLGMRRIPALKVYLENGYITPEQFELFSRLLNQLQPHQVDFFNMLSKLTPGQIDEFLGPKFRSEQLDHVQHQDDDRLNVIRGTLWLINALRDPHATLGSEVPKMGWQLERQFAHLAHLDSKVFEYSWELGSLTGEPGMSTPMMHAAILTAKRQFDLELAIRYGITEHANPAEYREHLSRAHVFAHAMDSRLRDLFLNQANYRRRDGGPMFAVLPGSSLDTGECVLVSSLADWLEKFPIEEFLSPVQRLMQIAHGKLTGPQALTLIRAAKQIKHLPLDVRAQSLPGQNGPIIFQDQSPQMIHFVVSAFNRFGLARSTEAEAMWTFLDMDLAKLQSFTQNRTQTGVLDPVALGNLYFLPHYDERTPMQLSELGNHIAQLGLEKVMEHLPRHDPRQSLDLFNLSESAARLDPDYLAKVLLGAQDYYEASLETTRYPESQANIRNTRIGLVTSSAYLSGLLEDPNGLFQAPRFPVLFTQRSQSAVALASPPQIGVEVREAHAHYFTYADLARIRERLRDRPELLAQAKGLFFEGAWSHLAERIESLGF